MKKLKHIVFATLFFFACEKEKENIRIPKVKEKKELNIKIKEINKKDMGLQFEDIVFVLDEDEKKKIDAIEMHQNDAFTSRKTKKEQENFWGKMEVIARELGFEPYWLYKVMIAESGINSSIQNRDTQATGLIQFMPSTAKMLGTTIYELQNMSPQEQLDYVYKFYLPYKNKITCPIDLYIVTFYPYARGRSNNYIIGSEASAGMANLIAKQNPNFDMDGNGYIELGEYRKYVRHKVFREVPDYVFQTYSTPSNKTQKNSAIIKDTVKPKKGYKKYNKNGFNITTKEE